MYIYFVIDLIGQKVLVTSIVTLFRTRMCSVQKLNFVAKEAVLTLSFTAQIGEFHGYKYGAYIHLTPEDQRFNWDVGLELPGCWVSTLKTLCVKPCPPPSV